jgi:hypothetical protein
VKSLNEVFSRRSVRRRYEVWFVRVGLADGSGAWWFRYLLMNPRREGCPREARGEPVQVWATWFPTGSKPQSFIQGFSLADLEFSARGQNPFHFRAGANAIDESSCRGALKVEGHAISWDLQYRSNFRVTLSDKGWIGFSRTPHSDAVFSGRITLDGKSAAGDTLGSGLQGHNCGYRHRHMWSWAHGHFTQPCGTSSTFEALFYEMPLGLTFRKAVLWHNRERIVFRKFQERERKRANLQWQFCCRNGHGLEVEAAFDGSGTTLHRLPYMKTDCSGSFEVANNSLARAALCVKAPSGEVERLETTTGAVVEMTGD